MVRSMTGYGIGTIETGKFKVTVEVKSINSRFCDIRLKLPQQLMPLETQIKKTVQSKISRGKVDCFITINGIEETEYDINVNHPFILGYIEAFHKIKNEFGLEGDLTTPTLLQLPGSMDFKIKEKIYQEDEISAVMQALDNALTSLDEMRTKEGSMIRDEVLARLVTMEEKRTIIESTCETIPSQHKKDLMTKLAQIGPEMQLDPGRLEQEVAYIAERCDISEEVSRLKGHFEHARSILQAGGEVGRRLDFIMQEVNREANTINSKVGNLDINRAVIEVKLESEKIREQAQNIE